MNDQLANKIYPDFETAQRACPGGYGYDLPTLAKSVVRKNTAYKFELNKLNILESQAARTLLGISMARSSNCLRVLDFGGGGGYHFWLVQKIFGEYLNLSWNVVETPVMCSEARELETAELKFASSIEEAKETLKNIDLVFASSSLQYTPNPSQTIQDLIEVSPRYLYITRTPFSLGNNRVVTIQKSLLSENGPGPLPSGYDDQPLYYPITFEPLSKVEEIISKKYKIIFKLAEESPTLMYEEVPLNQTTGIFAELK
jgi:putative methyltransferase (TIGR04325 family)